LNLYAESSAVLAWLLQESREAEIHDVLRAASLVVSSDLTLVEVDRALIRAVELEAVSEPDAIARRSRFAEIRGHWTVLRLDEVVVSEARRKFPKEPVRTLDALHLASALSAREAVPDLSLLSLDAVVRTNARALGFEVLPA